MGARFRIYKKYWAKEVPECGPLMPIFGYMESFIEEKIISKLTGRNSAAMRRNLGRTILGLRRSCSAEETSLREGEIITIVITLDPLSRRGSISINIFTSTISSQTLVHLLYPILSQNHKLVPIGCYSVDYTLQLILIDLLGGRSYVQILYPYYYSFDYEHEYAL